MKNGYITPYTDTELREKLAGIKHLALDMDGTIYLGGTLFPYTVPFLERMKSIGVGYSFLTNNPSKSVGEYVHKLSGMGIAALAEELYTSSLATIDYLQANHPAVKRLYIIGTPGMISEFEHAGYISCPENEEPECVVVGFDTALSYDRLCRASWWISRGKTYVATNPDRVCPTDLPTVLIDCGAVCKAIEWATGRVPEVVPGKPDPNMLRGVTGRFGLDTSQVAMVGDRLYTDVQLARNAGAFGVLVLSGETTVHDLDKCREKPDLTVTDIGVLGRLIAEARR